jgi:hypothetical protein
MLRLLNLKLSVFKRRTMGTTTNKYLTSSQSGGEKPILPGAKLPPMSLPGEGNAENLPSELRKAWIDYMVHGFRNNEEMFRRTLEGFMKPYQLTIWMYGILFAFGILLFAAAVIIGLRDSKSVVAIAFAGLGAGAFLSFFIRQPVQALEENLEFITWLGVAFNTYWTRLMYMMETKTIQSDLKAADEDYCASVERLINKHAELRGKRPGSDIDSRKPDIPKSEKKIKL